MKQICSYQELAIIMADLDRLPQMSPAVNLLLRQRIGTFRQENHTVINKLQKEMLRVTDKYVKKDEDGKFLTALVGDVQQYVFDDEETKKKYQDEILDFYSTSLELVV
jgi:hypothetical protein